ncbi:MAG TPA: chemotaxis protein CheW, partial [Chthoniobacteraceae bacterium]|nr:chemotaxis protein CheW [Chthoniobacteraceae bacterium]
PLAPAGVAGLLNVRGELVTAIDLRPRLELPARAADSAPMNIVLRTAEGAVSLLVDSVGEVIRVSDDDCEPPPPTLRGPARALTDAVVKLHDRLLLRLNTQAVISSPAVTPL